MTDVYNYGDRAGFLERLGALAGRTTFRLPSAGGVPYAARGLTGENALAMALSFARRGEHDIGPEVAYSIGTGSPHRRERVLAWLEAKLRTDTGPAGRRLACGALLAQHCYELVVFGKAMTRVPREARRPACWDAMVKIGTGWLWMRAEAAIERAEWSYRARDEVSPRNGAPMRLTA